MRWRVVPLGFALLLAASAVAAVPAASAPPGAAAHPAASAPAAKVATPSAPPSAQPGPSAPISNAGPVSSAQSAPSAAPSPNVPAGTTGQVPSAAPPNPHGAASPHGGGLGAGMPGMEELLRLVGSPFTSDNHMMLAALARRGHALQPESVVTASDQVPVGTIAVLVQDGSHNPIGLTKVRLVGVRKSIEEGDKPFEKETTTTAQGMAAFRDQQTDTSYAYEVVVDKDGATYSTPSFSFEHGKGAIVSLFVYPASTDPGQTMIFTRALYAIEPRSDVFQIQTLYRVHNAGVVTWRATDFALPLPPGASAFQPGTTPGVHLIQSGDSVLLNASFVPGQKEFTFSFQLPNDRQAVANLRLPVPLNLSDAKVVLEASNTMGLSVRGFTPAERTRSLSGEAALLSDQDFLQPNGHPPAEISVQITGMPPKGKGNVVTAAVALLIALGGIVQAMKREPRARGSNADRNAAQELILDELVRLEGALSSGAIGPETHARTKRLLLDALARLDGDGESQPKQPTAV